MTDDLKERLGAYGQQGKRGSDHPQSVVCRDALARIADMEARLAAAEAGEDALAKALREIANCGQSAEPDHWKFRCMAREKARAALAAYEARREK